MKIRIDKLMVFALLFACNIAEAKKGDGGANDHPGMVLDTVGTENNKLDQVVVTGQYKATSADKSVHKIRVIDRAKIDAMNAQNLRDVLTNEMNIRLSQDNILGSSMSMMGLSGENVKILIDGVPVIGRQNGNIDLSQVNLKNIESIEVVEGPMSVNFGTNALAGTINLITKKTLKHKVDAGATAYYETIGTYNLSANAGIANKNSTVLVSGGRYYFDGWSTGEQVSLSMKDEIADSNRFQQWKPKEQYFSDLQYIYRIKKTVLNYKGSYFQEKITNRGKPIGFYREDALDDIYRTYRLDNAVYMNTELKKDKNINVFVAYNDYKRIKNTYARNLTTLSSDLSKGEGAQDTSRFTLLSSRGTLSSGASDKKINYQAGYDISVEQAYGIRIKDKLKEIGDYAIFSTAELHFGNLTLRPGLRLAYNTQYDAPVIPSVNIRYKISPLFTLRASYGKGFRAPTLKELYFDFVDVNHNITGSETLKAEYSNSYALNITGARTLSGSLLRCDAGLFYNDIKNRISLAQISAKAAEYSYINIGVYKTAGGTVNAEYRKRNITVSAGATYTGQYDELSETEAGVPEMNYSMEARGSMTYVLKKAGTSFSLFCKYTGKTPGYTVNEDDKVLQTSISDYTMADATISKRLFAKRVNLAVGCKNIFVDARKYLVRFALLDGTEETTVEIAKDSSYNLAFLSFDDKKQVMVEPPKNSWDIVFTQYTHVFIDPPVPYLVTGCLLNRYNTSAVLDKVRTFAEIQASDLDRYDFSADINTIGYDWKVFTSENIYVTYPSMNYIIRNREGLYYKLHFIDFLDAGVKGNPKWEFQEL